jgi:hypothetical protein
LPGSAHPVPCSALAKSRAEENAAVSEVEKGQNSNPEAEATQGTTQTQLIRITSRACSPLRVSTTSMSHSPGGSFRAVRNELFPLEFSMLLFPP